MNNKAIYLSSSAIQEQLPIFFQPWWLDIVSKDWDMLLVVEGEKIQAVFPICAEKKAGLKLFRNPLLTPYLGPFFLASDTAGKELFNLLWQQVPQWDSFDLESTIHFQQRALFEELGFETQLKDTYVISLEKETTALFSKLNSNHRNLIRQASTLHTIEEGAEHLPVLLSLHKQTFKKKKKSYPFDATKITRLVIESAGRKRGSLFAARDKDGHVTACIFTVWDNDTMYLLLSTFHEKEAHPGAIRMLIWEAIQKAKTLNLAFFDFEGSMDPGIAAFFRRFGAERKTYLCASKTKSLLWNFKKKILG